MSREDLDWKSGEDIEPSNFLTICRGTYYIFYSKAGNNILSPGVTHNVFRHTCEEKTKLSEILNDYSIIKMNIFKRKQKY